MSIKELNITLPRRVHSIHQIEISSRCNFRCKYCVHKNMPREKKDMSFDLFCKVLDKVDFFVKSGTQHEINLAGIGESTLNPDFVKMVKETRKRFPNTLIIMATNGKNITEELAKSIELYYPKIVVSIHNQAIGGQAIQILKKYNLLGGISFDPSINPNNWAGQVDWPCENKKTFPCPWIRTGRVFVDSNGNILRCCLDSTGESFLAHISEINPNKIKTDPWKLCKNCYQTIAIKNYNQ